MTLAAEDIKDLRQAKLLLENVGLAMKITNSIGLPIEKGLAFLPKGWSDMVASSTRKALEIAADSAIKTLGRSHRLPAATRLHKVLAAGSGAAGGFFGLLSLPVELPISTAIMLRSIADIARSEGHLLTEPRIRLACIEVFALGGTTQADDAIDTGYFAVRSSLARSIRDAAQAITGKGILDKTGPLFARFITPISTRFGIQVSEKAAAQAIPILGAAGGALINALFIDHFQDMARGHFIVLRLENKYGAELVRQTYAALEVHQ